MARSFAGEYGLFLGIAWSLTFLAIVHGMSSMNGLLMMLGFVMYVSLIALPIYFGWRFTTHLEPGERLLGMPSWTFALMMLFDACLITAVVEFCYFQYVDGGTLLSTIREAYTSPEMTQQFKLMGMKDMQDMAVRSIDSLAMLSPFDLTFSLFTNNMLAALILSVPTSYIARRNNRKI